MNYGILFTGQGSQFPSMAKELIENYSAAEETFKKADEILGYSVSDICTKAELFGKICPACNIYFGVCDIFGA